MSGLLVPPSQQRAGSGVTSRKRPRDAVDSHAAQYAALIEAVRDRRNRCVAAKASTQIVEALGHARGQLRLPTTTMERPSSRVTLARSRPRESDRAGGDAALSGRR